VGCNDRGDSYYPNSLPCPNDYGEEMEQQAARKAAREYEWSGRREVSAKAAEIIQALLDTLQATCSEKNWAKSQPLVKDARKLLTSLSGPV
jgi:hypothetical protein